jgi:hypothetical protein
MSQEYRAVAGGCTKVLEIEYDPDCTPEQVEQVLLSLDRWSVRTAGHVNHHRGAERHDLRTVVIVEGSPPTPENGCLRQIFHIPTRNLSQKGLGLIVPPVFVPRVLSDATPLVRTDTVFRVGQEIKIRFGPEGTTLPALRGVIVRMRVVHLGFWELGVQLTARDGTPGGQTKPAMADCGCGDKRS